MDRRRMNDPREKIGIQLSFGGIILRSFIFKILRGFKIARVPADQI